MAAVGRRAAVIEVIGQRVAVGVGGAEQAGDLQRLARIRRDVACRHAQHRSVLGAGRTRAEWTPTWNRPAPEPAWPSLRCIDRSSGAPSAPVTKVRPASCAAVRAKEAPCPSGVPFSTNWPLFAVMLPSWKL